MNIDRRYLLKGSAALGASMISSGYVPDFASWNKQVNDSIAYDGLSDEKIDSEEFWKRFSGDFERVRPDYLEKGEPNAIIDFRPVYGYSPDGDQEDFEDLETVHISPSHLDEIEDLYREIGVNALCLRHRDEMRWDSPDGSIDIYEALTEGGLGSTLVRDEPEGLYGEVDEFYREHAVQVFAIPWELVSPLGRNTAFGINVGSATLVEEGFRDEFQVDIYVHELNHAFGAGHRDKDGAVMDSFWEDRSESRDISEPTAEEISSELS